MTSRAIPIPAVGSLGEPPAPLPVSPITEAQGNRICTLLAEHLEVAKRIERQLVILNRKRFY